MLRVVEPVKLSVYTDVMLNLFPESMLPQFPTIEHHAPKEIESASMRAISAELSARNIVVPEEQKPVVYRAIHASADFDYAQNLVFSDGVIPYALSLLRKKKPVIITDTNMALSGISQSVCAHLEIETHCFMADDDVAFASKESGLTRAACSVDKAARFFADGQGIPQRPIIFVCGNAPTALVRVRQLHDAEIFSPALVIGVPVGFVNVVAAKELILQSDLPCIVAQGRKGGSNIAAAIVNALLYEVRT